MINRLLACFLILSVTILSSGQQSPPAPESPARLRARGLLDDLPEQIKLTDEPAARVFMRLRLAAFLWSIRDQHSPSRPEALTAEALADLRDNESEIPELYRRSYQRELLALVRLRAPALADQYEASISTNAQDVAGSMLETRGGTAPAVEMVRQSLQRGEDPGSFFIFFLERLKRQQPAEVPRVLSAILDAEERRPSSISVETLFWLRGELMDERHPAGLRRRYLVTVLNATRRHEQFDRTTLAHAHDLLNALLPYIWTSLPSRYGEAAAQTAAMTTRAPREQREMMELRERIQQSNDRVEQLLSEARATQNVSLRNVLLSDAAQIALQQGNLRRAVDIAIDLPAEGQSALWRDQFLAEVTSSALSRRDTETAGYAASKMVAPLKRAAATQKIALYFFELGDVGQALEILNNAFKDIESADNDARKAVGLLEIAVAFARVDETRVSGIVQAAMSVINSIPAPNERRGSDARNQFVRDSLLPLVWNLILTFQELARVNGEEALNMAGSIRQREIRLPALLGVAMAILTQTEQAEGRSPQNAER